MNRFEAACNEAVESLPFADLKCEICGTPENLRCCPIMTGDSFREDTKRPVCSECIFAWSDGAGTTSEEILAYRKEECQKKQNQISAN